MYYFFTASTTYTETAHILCLYSISWKYGFNIFTFCQHISSFFRKNRDMLKDKKIRRRGMETLAEEIGNKKRGCRKSVTS